MLVGFALAQDGPAVPTAAMPLDPPLPLTGAPHPLAVRRWLLPVQDPAWLTDTAERRSCEVLVDVAPGAPPALTLGACPAPMGEAALAATAAWDFALPDGAGPTRAAVRYVARYAEALGAMTLHAEMDPGEEEALLGAAGVPGLRLVHPAWPRKAKAPKAPKALRGAPPCPVSAVVDPLGRAVEVRAEGCPAELAPLAERAVLRWRFVPRFVDGAPEASETWVDVSFR